MVKGVKNPEHKEKILTQENLDLERAVKLVKTLETARKSKEEMDLKSGEFNAIKGGQSKPTQFKNHQLTNTSPGERCKSCNYTGHSSKYEERQAKCPAFSKTCNGCGKKGHFRSVCRNVKSVNSIENSGQSNGISEINSFGVFFGMERCLNPLSDGKLSHKVCNQFGEWQPAVFESHSRVEVKVSLIHKACGECRFPNQ